VQATVNEYFNSAPVGKIFATSAESLKPTYRGTKDSKVGPVFATALTRVEQGKQSAADAWTQALKEATDAAK
jgi:cellobiose transport system substrate-binding protein